MDEYASDIKLGLEPDIPKKWKDFPVAKPLRLYRDGPPADARAEEKPAEYDPFRPESQSSLDHPRLQLSRIKEASALDDALKLVRSARSKYRDPHFVGGVWLGEEGSSRENGFSSLVPLPRTVVEEALKAEEERLLAQLCRIGVDIS